MHQREKARQGKIGTSLKRKNRLCDFRLAISGLQPPLGIRETDPKQRGCEWDPMDSGGIYLVAL